VRIKIVGGNPVIRAQSLAWQGHGDWRMALGEGVVAAFRAIRWGPCGLVRASLCLAIALACGRSVWADDAPLQIFYRLNPPLIVKQDGRPSGFVYEFMKYVLVDKLKLVKTPDEFTEVPLARGLHSVEFNKSTLFFNVISSPEREQKFKLIKIPGIFEKTYLYGRRDSNLQFNKIEDTVNYNIGFVNGSSSLQFMQKNMGDSLKYEITQNHESNLKKLLSGRVDLIAAPEYNLDYISSDENTKNQIVKIIFLEKNNFYVVVNKDFEAGLFNKIDQAIIEASTEPIYNDLLIKYKDNIQY